MDMKKEEVKSIVKDFFELECQIVGNQTVDDCIDIGLGANKSFKQVEYGAKADLKTIIEMLVAVVTFINTAIEIYTKLKILKKQEIVEPKEIDKEAIRQFPKGGLIEETKRFEIIDRLIALQQI